MRAKLLEDQNHHMDIPLDENSILVEKINAMKNLIEVQRKCLGTRYMIGLYNGLVLGLSVLTGEEPVFFEQEEDKEEK